MTRRRSKGFTLLEVMLVVLLTGVVLGLAGVVVGRDPQRMAGQESGLFLQVVQHARQQAVLQGREMGLSLDTHGYRLMKRVGRTWEAEGQHRDTKLDLRLEIEGLPVMLTVPGGSVQLMFSSNDEYTPFSLVFQEAGIRLAHVTSDGLNDPWIER